MTRALPARRDRCYREGMARNGSRPTLAALRRGAACIALLALGCASLSRPEPGVIVVRNASGRDVERVTLAIPASSPGGITRHGSLAPVPRGVSQVVVRPSDPPPLAGRVEVRWTETGGRSWSVPLDLKTVLRDARGGPDEALVFELLPHGDVAARVVPWRR